MSILIYFATIFWSLFPNLIHVFQGGDNFINKVNATNLVVNGDFENTSLWSAFYSILSVSNNVATLTISELNSSNRIQHTLLPTSTTDLYYFSAEIFPKYNNLTYFGFGSLGFNYFTPIPNEWNFYSAMNDIDLTNNTASFRLYHSTATQYAIGDIIKIRNIKGFNVSQMIDKGVKNDSGISFSDLTVLEIQEQLDLWINEYGNLDFQLIYDNTADSWFDTGFVEKTAERDFLDYLGYFVWLLTPPIILFATLDLLRRVI